MELGRKPLLLLGFATVLLSGCLKTEEFPVEPAITFKSFGQYGDSASLTLEFTDGDGDIGLGQGDTLAPYNQGGAYYYNLVFDVYRMENGVWSAPITGGHRIPVITPTGQNKTLEGEIERAFTGVDVGNDNDWWDIFYIGTPNPPVAGDTLRIDARLIDRALHISNTVGTGNIILQ